LNTRDKRKSKRIAYLKKLENNSPDVDLAVAQASIVLESQFDMEVLDYAMKVGKAFMKYNRDCQPHASFIFDKKEPNKRVVMVIRNEDCSTFMANLDRQLHDKFTIEGKFNDKIYFLLFRQLGLIIQEKLKRASKKK